jgi:hypothetical protein
MPAATLNLSGRKFVVIPQREYLQLKAKAARNGKQTTRSKRRPNRQDRGDVAESLRRMSSDKSVPLEKVARELGFDPASLRR